jgi:hypothetical protein
MNDLYPFSAAAANKRVAVLEDKDFHENMACVRAPTRTKMKFEFLDPRLPTQRKAIEKREVQRLMVLVPDALYLP